MRPAEFTPEVIIEAGQGLQATGRNITGFALRQKIGGGNPARLKQVWDEYINSQTTSKAEPVAELPVEVAEEVASVTKALTERLATLAVELNDKAVKAAERRVHEVVRSAGEQREQAERELADASQTVDDLESKLDEAAVASAGLDKRLADCQAANQAQAVELAQVGERVALAEKSAKAATELHAGELARLNASIEAERKIHKREAEQLRADLAQLQSELAKVQAKADAANQTYQEQRKQSAAEALRVAERLTRVETARDAALKEVSAAREAAARLQGQVETLRAQAAEQLRVFSLGKTDASDSGKKC